MDNLNNNEMVKYYLPKTHNKTTQKFESDYIMPDYEAEIMRILKFKAEPYISNKTITNNKLTLDISVVATVIYQSYDMNVYSAKTESSFVKNIDIPDNISIDNTKIKLSSESVNCKATGKRRVEFTGNIIIDFHLLTEENLIINIPEDDSLECKYHEINFKVLDRITEKRINIKEEIEENFSDVNIMETICEAKITDYRVVSDKIVVKGDAICHCICINDELKIQTKKFVVPFGQIIDAEGISSETNPNIEAIIQYINVDSGKEEQKPIVELSLIISCECFKELKTKILTDVYSIKHKLSLNQKTNTIPSWSENETKRFVHEINLGKTNEEITNINHLSVKVNCFTNKNNNKIKSLIECFIMGSDSSKTAIGNEKVYEFEDIFDSDFDNKNCDINAKVIDCNYNFIINDREEIVVSVDYEIEICSVFFNEFSIIESVDLLEEFKQQKGKTAIIIYYASKGESIFNIAKKYNTKVKSILEENSIETDVLTSSKHLIIPIF